MSATDDAKVLEDAAIVWERRRLPDDFTVEGYIDGKDAHWTVTAMLRLIARRIRDVGDGHLSAPPARCVRPDEARFIEHAREDVLSLIARVRELEQEREDVMLGYGIEGDFTPWDVASRLAAAATKFRLRAHDLEGNGCSAPSSDPVDGCSGDGG